MLILPMLPVQWGEVEYKERSPIATEKLQWMQSRVRFVASSYGDVATDITKQYHWTFLLDRKSQMQRMLRHTNITSL
jgi:hypothetical protein